MIQWLALVSICALACHPGGGKPQEPTTEPVSPLPESGTPPIDPAPISEEPPENASGRFGELRISPVVAGDLKTLPPIRSYSNGRLAVTWTSQTTDFSRSSWSVTGTFRMEEIRNPPQAGWPGDEYWGFVDLDGNVVVEPIYYDANFYSEGLAAVSVGSRGHPQWGMIDIDGNVVIPFEYEWLGCMSEGLVPFANGGKFGYIDRQQRVVIAARFGGAFPFFADRALVTLRSIHTNAVDKSPRWIDRLGRVRGVADEIDPLEFLRRRKESAAPLERFEQDGSWGFRTAEKVVVIPTTLNDALPFTEGLASVDRYRGDGTSEYVDAHGELVFSLPYDGVAPVADGRIVRSNFPAAPGVEPDERPEFVWAVYNARGELVFDEIRGYRTPPRHVELRDSSLGSRSVPTRTQDQERP